MSTKAQLQEIYIGLLGRAADPAGLEYWANEVDTGVLSIAQVRENIVNDQPEYEDMYEGKTREEVVNQLYINLFGRPAEAAGLEYWTVDPEGSAVTIDDLIFALSDGAGTSDRQALDNRVEVAQYYTDNAAAYSKEDSAAIIADVDANPATVEDAKDAINGGEQPSVPGDTFMLTEGRDVITGTDNDDVFEALVGQNQNGAVSNALSTGDVLDGGAGRDRIEATMINDNETDGLNIVGQAPRPITSNIEEVSIEALEAVRLDATRMEGVEEFWSDFSRGDLTIANVNLRGSNVNNTNDITFGLKDAEAGVGLVAGFESQALVRPAANQINSQLLIRIADVSTETPETPLANVSVNLGFSLGGTAYELESVVSTDGTYAGLVAAIKNALVAEGLPAVNVSLSAEYEEVTFAGNTVNLPFTAQEILLTDPAGNAFESINFTQRAIEPVPGGFLVAGNADPVDPSVVGTLIETNLILDSAGRGSVAGDVQIGGFSNSGRGIEKFNVSVDGDSAIESLNTTFDRLQEIDIASIGANGSLYIGATQAGLNEIDANAFAGSVLQLGGSKGTHIGTTINNLKFLDAGQTSANVVFLGENTDGTVASIQTGSGDDNIVLHQTGISGSLSTPTQVVINAGAGNNTVTLSTDNVEANTAVVTTGAGNDVVTGGGNRLTVNTGAGNDVIYADNSGAKAEGTLLAGAAFAASTQSINGVDVATANLLYGRDVRVTLTVSDQVADSFATGFEAIARIEPTAGRYLTTEGDLYRAIAKAINEDAVLSKLAEATIDSNGHLKVSYLIDGVSGDDSVQFEILGEWSDLQTTQRDGITNELKSAYSNSTIAAVEAAYDAAGDTGVIATTGGAESVAGGGTNVVNAGVGNDVIVLSSDEAVLDAVVLNAGNFGHNTIVHFDDAQDRLSFNAWLDNVASASDSVESQVRIDSTVTTGISTIVENSVTVTDFSSLALATGVTFANMTATQVLGVLNTSGGFGTLDGDRVGDTVKAILLVENNDGDGNLGEYKVFEVTGNTNANVTNDFTGVSLVGTLDFGESVALADLNIV